MHALSPMLSSPTQPQSQKPHGTYCHPDLVERISSWRTRVHPYSSSALKSTTTSTTRLRNRQLKPYSRPQVASVPQQSYQNNVLPTVLPPPDALPASQTPGRLSSYDVYRGPNGSELPDPVRNPLTSVNTSDLAGEYCRMMLVQDQLQVRRKHLEILCLRNLGDSNISQQLLDIGATIQRITRTIQYLVAHCQRCGLNLDFNTIYSKYCAQFFPPTKTAPFEEPRDFIKMPQARAFNEAWKFNPL